MALLRHARKPGIRFVLLFLGLVVPLAAGASTFVGTVRAASAGLVAAYSFDQGGGATLTDVSGNGNHGSISGATWTSAGKYGSALSFNGSSSWVTVPDAASLDLTSGMTLEAWVRPASLSGWRAIMDKEQPGELVYALYANSDSNQPDGIVYNSGAEHDARGGAQLPLSTWSHLAATYDGSTLRLVVNGVQAAVATYGGSIVTSAGALRIGGNSVWGEWFNGLIDEVRVYDHALTATEIQSDMTTPVGASSPPPSATDPVAAYAFDAGAGSSAADDSRHGNTGAITGATWTAGHSGNALSFDGAGDWVTVADSASLDLSRQMTLEAWVKPSVAQGTLRRMIVGKEGAGELTYSLYSNTGYSTPAGGLSSNSPSESIVRGPLQLPVGAWSHLAATYDGATIRLYVNGTDVSDLAVTRSIDLSSAALRIGGNSVVGEYFNGLIDDVRVYNRSLTASEIQTDMKTPVAGPPTPAPDTQAPSAPAGLTKTSTSATSISVSWSASTDNVGVAGYGLYKNGASAGSTTSTSSTFSGLTCATSYTLAVDAYDAAGNRSGKTSITASTAVCGDTQAPTAPAGVASSSASPSSVTVSWSASTDNVGVAGYGVYKNGASAGSTTSTSYTFGSLNCGTTYSFAVDAFDAAGNRSAKTTVSASTSTCPPPSSASVFVSASGSDGNPCSQAAPCASLNRGYHVAQPGQVVQVAAGSYPSQSITADGSKTSSVDVVIQPALGASVTINGGLSISGSHFTLRDVTVTSMVTLGYGSSPTDVTLQNINGENFNVYGGSSFITFKGGDWGPTLCYTGHSGAQCEATIAASVVNGVNTLPHDITFDGIYIHDYQTTSTAYHVTCMFIVSGYNITIRNSKFRNCSVQDVFMQDWPGNGLHDVTIENNWMDAPRDQNGVPQGNIALAFSGRNGIVWTNFLVRNNTIMGAIDAGNGQTGGWNNTRIVGNLGENPSCQQGSGLTWSHNVWTGRACSSSDRLVSDLGVMDYNGFNYHLKLSSPAINAGDPNNYSPTDIDGQTRPIGGAPDAGADEAA